MAPRYFSKEARAARAAALANTAVSGTSPETDAEAFDANPPGADAAEETIATHTYSPVGQLIAELPEMPPDPGVYPLLGEALLNAHLDLAWPKPSQLERAHRHMGELMNALPEAIGAADGDLRAGLEAVRDLLFGQG